MNLNINPFCETSFEAKVGLLGGVYFVISNGADQQHSLLDEVITQMITKTTSDKFTPSALQVEQLKSKIRKLREQGKQAIKNASLIQQIFTRVADFLFGYQTKRQNALKVLEGIEGVKNSIDDKTIESEAENLGNIANELDRSLNDWLNDSSSLGNKKEAVRKIKEAFKNKSTLLDLSNLELTDLPACIGDLEVIQKLNLGSNNLQNLPKEVYKLANLQFLYLDNNQLETLPHEVCELKNLQILYLGSNQLETLPTEIGNLKNLTELILSRNQLKYLPEEMSNLKKLWYLDLMYNTLLTELLTKLAESFSRVKYLSLEQ